LHSAREWEYLWNIILENKVNKNGIIDEDAYDDGHERSVTLSKTDFSDLVLQIMINLQKNLK
jgi:hypothetical protein